MEPTSSIQLPRYGRLPTDLSDDQWQNIFRKLRADIKPSIKRNMNDIKRALRLIKCGWRSEQFEPVKGQSEDYCNFINDILSTIRSGRNDYCYFIYQIEDLLKYEHDRLLTEYIQEDQCIKVWLAKN